RSLGLTGNFEHFGDDGLQLLLRQQLIHKSHFFRNVLIEDDATCYGVNHLRRQFARLLILHLHTHLDVCMLGKSSFVISDNHFGRGIEFHPLTCNRFFRRALSTLSQVVQTKHHVLRRNGDRCAVGRVEDVVRRQHQDRRFEDRFLTQRNVNRHLVTVEVGVERRTHERVQLDSLTFNQLGLEGLDTETVQRRSTVEQYRVTFEYVFKDIPNHRILAVDNLLGRLHRLDNSSLNELADNERLEQFSRHVLGQTAFMQFQFRTNDDNGTTGVVDTLTEKVLTEASLLTLEHVAQRFQRAVSI